jgi:hypothetical protein
MKAIYPRSRGSADARGVPLSGALQAVPRTARFALALGLAALVLSAGCRSQRATSSVSSSVPVIVAERQEPTPPPAVIPVPVVESSVPVSGVAAGSLAAVPEPVPVEAPPVLAAAPRLSPAAEDVVRLAQAQVGDEVLLAFVDDTTRSFQLKASDIVYLTDVGVSDEVVTAMIRHDQQLRADALERLESASVPAGQTTAAAWSTSDPGQGASVAPVEAAAESGPPPEGQQVTHHYFYHTLSPYGTWVEVPDHGWCWRPTVAVVQPDWRPYFHNGRWVWTDHGWYWRSYYSWGWAPFHYGRWYLSGSWGWVWAPDVHWGPAWVTWRYHQGYCGWAPLPPRAVYLSGVGLTWYGSRVSVGFGFGLGSACYSFVPVTGFYTARPWAYAVARPTVNNFYGQTTIINNYIQGNNNTIINEGIGTDRIRAGTRNEIHKVRLADSAAPQPGQPVQTERLNRDGTALAVYRPKLPAQAAAPPPSVTSRQEIQKTRAESLVRSEPVRAATVNAQSRSAAAPQLRSGDRPTTSSAAPAQRPLPTRPDPGAGSAVERSQRPLAPSTPRAESPVTRTEPSRVTRPVAPAPATRVEPSRQQPGAVTPPPSTPARPQPAAPATRFERPVTDPRQTPQNPSPAVRTTPVAPSSQPTVPASPRIEPSRVIPPAGTIQPGTRIQPQPAAPSVITPSPRSRPAPAAPGDTRSSAQSRTEFPRSAVTGQPFGSGSYSVPSVRSAPIQRPSAPVASAGASVPSRNAPAPAFQSAPARAPSVAPAPSRPAPAQSGAAGGRNRSR